MYDFSLVSKALLIPADAVPTLVLACLVTGFFAYWFGYWMCFFENGSDDNDKVSQYSAERRVVYIYQQLSILLP